MRWTTVVALFFLVLLSACGGSSKKGRSDVIDGAWSAVLSGPSPTFDFTASLAQSSGTTVDVTSFRFNGPVLCFSDFRGETSTFNSTGVVNGNVTGQFTLTVTTLFPGTAQNVLVLQGNVTGRQIAGTWTVTGGASNLCPSGSGNFTMMKTG